MSEDGKRASATPGKSGIFVCVNGPSGAGKDTLIRLARARLGDDTRFLFPCRLVTRPASPFEEHAILSPAQFDEGIRDGHFALHWRAHGLGYAIDRTVLSAIAAGRTIVCNISRDSIAAAREKFAHVKVVLVTAPQTMIAARLAARGREAPADLAERLLRNADYAGQADADVAINNIGAPEEAAGELTRFLIALRGATV